MNYNKKRVGGQPKDDQRKTRKRRRGDYDYASTNLGRAVAGQKPVDRILELLAHLNCKVSQSGDGWIAQCPAHADSNPSLSVAEASDGRVLLNCFVGCTPEDILEELDLTFQDLFPVPERTPATRQQPPIGKPASNRSQSPSRETSQKAAAPLNKKWAALTLKYQEEISPKKREHLAEQLGVRRKDLEALRIGWKSGRTPDTGLYTFPEHDGSGHVIGIATRAEDGSKGFLKDGHRGLYLPKGWDKRPGAILIAEGATDTAALATMKLAGIGRPSATGGVEFLADLLSPISEKRPIVVLAEFDPKPDGSWPGRDGAEKVANKLAQKLDREINWGLMPNKSMDVREWLAQRQQEGDYDD